MRITGKVQIAIHQLPVALPRMILSVAILVGASQSVTPHYQMQSTITDMTEGPALATTQESSDRDAKPQAYTTMARLEEYLIADKQVEVSLARSAAPAAISGEATVLVLTPRGYETAVTGKNGFVCVVNRAWQAPFSDPEFWNPKLRAPECLNPQAVRSILPMQMKRTELALARKSKDEIMARTKAAFEKKEFGLPEVGAMSYMMSKQQYLADRFGHWHPHLMFYLPGTLKAAEWGANLPKSPVILGPEELPDGTREPVLVFLVPLSRWSDDTPAEAHQ